MVDVVSTEMEKAVSPPCHMMLAKIFGRGPRATSKQIVTKDF